MLSKFVEVLIYAAALDVYSRYNRSRNPFTLTGKEVNAMLVVVDWQARPQLLTRE